MKKFLISTVLTVILLGWAFITNAKESNTLRLNNSILKLEDGKWCDVNGNKRVDIDDITRIIDNCFLNWGSSKKCDLNRNWKIDIEDTTYFYDTCSYKILNQPKISGNIKKIKVQQTNKNRNIKANKKYNVLPIE